VMTRAETRFHLSAKRTSPFKLAGASVQSTTGSRGVRISASNTGYTMFRGGVKSTAYPLHSPVSPSLPLPCVTVCHHISTGVYINIDVLKGIPQHDAVRRIPSPELVSPVGPLRHSSSNTSGMQHVHLRFWLGGRWASVSARCKGTDCSFIDREIRVCIAGCAAVVDTVWCFPH
jgi:hypothetical protein